MTNVTLGRHGDSMVAPFQIKEKAMAALETLPVIGNAWTQLHDWQKDGMQLGFVYSRSLGGLVQTGQCRIARLSEDSAILETAGSRMMVVVAGARLEAGPQIFFTPNLRAHYPVEGVALHLANHDWLFFSECAVPDDARLNNEH
jgi:hypothetical protein